MQITRPPHFQPIHIVLETEDEMDQLRAMLCYEPLHVLPIIAEINEHIVAARNIYFDELIKATTPCSSGVRKGKE